MAGRPQKRIKALTTALRANGIDPEQLLTAAPGATNDATPTAGLEDLDGKHTHTRTREARGPLHARVQIGPATRNEADRLTASDLSRLAGLLAPGLTVRIERTRPTWAAGWVEDIMIDDHDLGALLDYLSQEHGGQMYRASVIAVDGAQLYTARIPIAGPPRQRGRLRTRGAWDGSEDTTPIAAPQHQQTASGFGIPDLVQLLGMLQGQQSERQETLIQSVREMNAASQNTTNAMLKALMTQREETKQGGSLREQLRELVQATHAIEEVREVLGSNTPTPSDNDEDKGPMKGIMEKAAAEILIQGLRNDQARQSNASPHTMPPGFRRVPQQPRQRPPQQPAATTAAPQPKAAQ